MSGPKVVRIVTRQEIVAACEAHLARLDAAAGAYVAFCQKRGLATDDEQLELQEAKTQVTQLEALQHTLSPDELRPSALRSEAVVTDIMVGVNRLEKIERWKRHALVPVWIFLGIMAVLFWAKREQFERKH